MNAVRERDWRAGFELLHAVAEAGEGVGLELAGLLLLAHRTQGEAEVAGGAQRLGVVLAQHPAAAGQGVGLEVAGLLVLVAVQIGWRVRSRDS